MTDVKQSVEVALDMLLELVNSYSCTCHTPPYMSASDHAPECPDSVLASFLGGMHLQALRDERLLIKLRESVFKRTPPHIRPERWDNPPEPVTRTLEQYFESLRTRFEEPEPFNRE